MEGDKNCNFIINKSSSSSPSSNVHSHEHSHGHSHEHGHGHTHEILENPGSFILRPAPHDRDFSDRAFTVGIGGYLNFYGCILN
jgi:urease accessory protein